MTEQINQKIRARAEQLRSYCIGFRRDIHMYPELGFHEYRTTERICEELDKLGISYRRLDPTGVTGEIVGTAPDADPSRIICLRADIDALPIQEMENGLPYRSIHDGVMHACGHHLLGIGSIAAAAAVKEYLLQNDLPGTVIYYGCPGEEGGSGKAFMARDHIFDDLDAAITWHPNDSTHINNASSLANCQILYRFKGISAHAAGSPHLGRSALDAVELMNVGVQFLREHIIPEARIHYAITNAGGDSPNVVQAEAEVLYLIRSPQNYQVRELHERVSNIAKGAALMTGTTVEEDFIKACSGLVPNHTLEKIMWKNISELAAPEYTKDELDFAADIRNTCPLHTSFLSRCQRMIGVEAGAEYAEGYRDVTALYTRPLPYRPSDKVASGSSDVGDVSRVCPVVQAWVTAFAADTPGHSWQEVAQGKNSAAHKGEIYAAQIMTATAIDLIHVPHIMEAAKLELHRRLAADGGSYISLIPPGIKPRSMVSLSKKG